MTSYFIYILRNSQGQLYVGQTNNLQRRIKEHLNKTSKSAKFIKENSGFKLVYKEKYPTLIEAMRREKQLKGWSKAKKVALIEGNVALLKQLSKSNLRDL